MYIKFIFLKKKTLVNDESQFFYKEIVICSTNEDNYSQSKYPLTKDFKITPNRD